MIAKVRVLQISKEPFCPEEFLYNTLLVSASSIRPDPPKWFVRRAFRDRDRERGGPILGLSAYKKDRQLMEPNQALGGIGLLGGGQRTGEEKTTKQVRQFLKPSRSETHLTCSFEIVKTDLLS